MTYYLAAQVRPLDWSNTDRSDDLLYPGALAIISNILLATGLSWQHAKEICVRDTAKLAWPAQAGNSVESAELFDAGIFWMKHINPRSLRYSGQNNRRLINNAAHQFAATHAMAVYQASAIYSFIPKNACSTMRFSIACANGLIASDAQVLWIHKNNDAFRPTLAELVTANYAFVVLRDPFRRIASCFLDKFAAQDKVVSLFVKRLGGKIDPNHLSFREFIKLLPEVLRADQHWRPQVDFLVYQQYDDYFCVEDFGRSVETLDRRIGLIVRDTRQLLSHGTEQYKVVTSNSGHHGISIHEVAEMKARGEIPAVESMFDEEIIALVRKIYADDFAIYAERIGKPCLFT